MRTIVYGAGYWAKNYIRELGHHCVGVIDPRTDRLADVRSRFNAPVFKKLPDDLDFQAVIISTDPREHYNLAIPHLDAGRYVLVEKPMAMHLNEAKKMAEYDRCMNSLVYLYHPEVEWLKEVASGTILSHAYSRRTNQGPVRDWANALWDLAPHDISIFNYVFGGPPEDVKGIHTRDWAVAVLTYGEVDAIIYVSWHGGPKERKVELVPDSDSPRVVFDDMSVVLEEPPLTRQVRAFMSKEWNKGTAQQGVDVVAVLEALTS